MESFLDKYKKREVTESDIDTFIQKWHDETDTDYSRLDEYLGFGWEEFSKYVVAGRLVPKGIYCYDDKGVCPFWSIDKNKEIQENGYCSLMKKGDLDLQAEGSAFSLLWDMCKECDFELEDDKENIVF